MQLAREDAGASLYTVISSYYGELSAYYEQCLEDNEEVIATDTRPGAREKAEARASDLRDVFKELEKEVMENLSKIRAAMSTTITQASTSTPTSLAQREDCARRHNQLADSGQSTDGSPRGPVDVIIPAGNNQPTCCGEMGLLADLCSLSSPAKVAPRRSFVLC